MKRFLLPIFLFFGIALLHSQDTLRSDSIDYYEMSLEQLMNLKSHGIPSELEALINQLIAAASKKPLSTRESPNIVTLITDEDIRNSGARDIMDVLNLVPGLNFGVDVEGVVGLGMRGNWGHEGKILVLLDGQEMNEIMFATTQFGAHFPLDMIKKIEVIRGPGSATFGGFAEYGVINIITRSAEELEGFNFTGQYSRMTKGQGGLFNTMHAGFKRKDLKMSLGIANGGRTRSDQDYTDIYDSTTYNMLDSSGLSQSMINFGLSYKRLSLRYIFDGYSTSVRDAYDYAKDSAYHESFNGHYAELKYATDPQKKYALSVKLNYKHQAPWKTTNVDSLTSDYVKLADRYTGQVLLSWNPTRKINFTGGAEFFQDIATDKTDSSFFSNGEQTVGYFNQAYFLQGLIKTRIVNFIVGARTDIHSEYGSAFVPRIGLTKKIKKFNFKLLYSNSFRAPSIENINLAPITGITPELTTVIELETGFQLNKHNIITLNVFDITTRNPIIYFYDDSLLTDNYENSDLSMGTMGLEAEYRFKHKRASVTLNYAFYTTSGKDRVEDYAVEENEAMLLAFPSHKITLNATYAFTKQFSANISSIWQSARYGYSTVDTSFTSVIEEFEPGLYLNAFLHWTLKKVPATFSLGVHDILNTKTLYIQPYNGYHAPLPGPSREIVFRICIDANGIFKEKEKKE